MYHVIYWKDRHASYTVNIEHIYCASKNIQSYILEIIFYVHAIKKNASLSDYKINYVPTPAFKSIVSLAT